MSQHVFDTMQNMVDQSPDHLLETQDMVFYVSEESQDKYNCYWLEFKAKYDIIVDNNVPLGEILFKPRK